MADAPDQISARIEVYVTGIGVNDLRELATARLASFFKDEGLAAPAGGGSFDEVKVMIATFPEDWQELAPHLFVEDLHKRGATHLIIPTEGDDDALLRERD